MTSVKTLIVDRRVAYIDGTEDDALYMAAHTLVRLGTPCGRVKGPQNLAPDTRIRARGR